MSEGEPSPAALKQRLGRLAIGGSRDVEAVAELVAGEVVPAVTVAVWQRRGWVVAATDAGLRLARRPRLFGRARQVLLARDELMACKGLRDFVPLERRDEFAAVLSAGRGVGN